MSTRGGECAKSKIVRQMLQQNDLSLHSVEEDCIHIINAQNKTQQNTCLTGEHKKNRHFCLPLREFFKYSFRIQSVSFKQIRQKYSYTYPILIESPMIRHFLSVDL